MSKKSKIAENLKVLELFNYDSSDSEEANKTIGQIVEVTFEGFTAEEDDFHGIQRLLAQSFRGLDVNLSELSDLIIAQNYVGCVIKEVIDDEKEAMEIDENALEGTPDQEGDYIFGLNTAINITQTKKRQPCVTAIRKALEERCQESSASDQTKEMFTAVLNNATEHAALLINERLINLPADVALPAFRSLQSEIEEANKINLPFEFQTVILIAKTYKITTLKSKKKNRRQGGDGSMVTKEKEVWANLEEEVFAEYAVGSFEYCVQDCNTLTAESWNEKEADQKHVRPFRKVLIIPAARIDEALDKAEAAIKEGEASK